MRATVILSLGCLFLVACQTPQNQPQPRANTQQQTQIEENPNPQKELKPQQELKPQINTENPESPPTTFRSTVSGSLSTDYNEVRQLLNAGRFREARFKFFQPNRDKLASLESAEANLLGEAWTAWEKNKPKEALRSAYNLMDVFPVSIRAHKSFEIFYDRIATALALESDQEAEDYREMRDSHARLANGLVESISSSGSGKSLQSGYKVFSQNEAEAFLDSIGLQPKDTSSLNQDGIEGLKVIIQGQRNTPYAVYFRLITQN